MKTEKSICDHLFEEKLKLDVCCVIAAAGLSSRMGLWKGDLKIPSYGEPGKKQILLIENAVNTALESCRKVILVGGEQMPRIREIFFNCKELILVENREYQRGMLSSIQTAMSCVDSDFFIMPMDMPLLTWFHLFKIHDAYSIRNDSKVFRPVFQGSPGHPVLLPYSWKKRVLKMKGKNLKANLSDDDQVLIPWGDESVVLDLDTQESYEQFLRDYSSS
ncbi:MULTISPECIES: NTP transferase domain-containing protein [unclassified Oceanispirochaeta]|uniref:nucleotidyltransferase family protein n=1 Tax=unclassified Oceanispirochaeta TaxID=2635722 RepID=UPI000E09C7E1|nr:MULTISPECIES: nucleotidyltransferase family protein [unclassified Oceanispirochaeta]MBF9015093.1 nucleotidyltransferase family protein [Oceanispirochaeta sp. M2]NPD71551.1 nucleotidyltransferase family protein [Oceanispirochaeta sp. M1]RDG33121.1 nucleotidyltransferase family protein [Oceanispirochaeta sp. M1]